MKLLFVLMLVVSFGAQAQTICEGNSAGTDHNRCSKIVEQNGRKYFCAVDEYGRQFTMTSECPRLSGRDVKGNDQNLKTAQQKSQQFHDKRLGTSISDDDPRLR